MALGDAIRQFVLPGAAIHLAYGGARPNAAVAEIVRQFAGTRPGFTVSAHGFVNSQHAMIAAGLIERLCVAFAGENYPSPRPNPVMQRALAAGEVTIENWSIWTLTARLMAGALGVDAFPVRALAGSDLEREHEPDRYRLDDAFGTGSGTGMVRALRPDVVLLQAIAADEDGNVVLAAPYGEGRWGAMAARVGVIACVERIVDSDVLRRYNSRPILAGTVVKAVCHVPRGSHPYGLWGGGFPGIEDQANDDTFMAEVRRAARTAEEFDQWVATWVTGPADHGAYLKQLDARAPVTATAPRPRKQRARSWSEQERMTVTAARIIRRRVAEAGHDTVLAGIGFAHLAAWIAAAELRAAGTPIDLLAELGMVGLNPRAGDPYLFAIQNLPSCTSMAEVADVLGCAVSGPATSCLGVLGAGQVDAEGNINSTWSDDGDFLVGSGGANDVASAAAEVVVVVTQGTKRLVPKVRYITAPGRGVSTIVTTEAVFERIEGRFVVTGWMGDPALDRDAIVAHLRPRTGWEVVAATTVDALPEPTADELANLRSFDPQGVFFPR